MKAIYENDSIETAFKLAISDSFPKECQKTVLRSLVGAVAEEEEKHVLVDILDRDDLSQVFPDVRKAIRQLDFILYGEEAISLA